MKIYLDDHHCRDFLTPLSLTRNVADMLVGILTIREKWKVLLGDTASFVEQKDITDDCIVIPSNILPDKNNYRSIINACKQNEPDLLKKSFNFLQHPCQLFQYNDEAIRNDFEWLKHSKVSKSIADKNFCLNETDIFIEEGARVLNSSLNAEEGPIYIGKNALIMEGTCIRGPFSLGANSVVKMGAKIYGATSIGDNCVVGGEIKNSIIFNNSNKAHDGYLGDSVIGSWCNLGAGTSNSNIKNNASTVTYKIDQSDQLFSAGIKAGLIMGDYSRTAINTSFNTGSVVGVCCHIFNQTMPPKYTEHFSWGDQVYDFDKAIRDIANWKSFKQQKITEHEMNQLKIIYQHRNQY